MDNAVTKLLGTQYPVIQAAMSYVTEAQLAAAVCNAGGLGVIGTNPGVRIPERDAYKTGEIMRREIHKLRELTDKPFGINYVTPVNESDPSRIYADAVKKVFLEEKVPFIVMVSTMNDFIENEIKALTAAGANVLYREISCTVETCVRAAQAGAKAIIVTGLEGGGHVSDYNMTLLNILPQVTDVLTDIPIIASGGIINTKTARAAAAMGAAGAYCGTCFLLADECCAHPDFKQLLLDSRGEDAIIWRASTARMVTNQNYVGRICNALDRGGATRKEIRPHYAGKFGKAMLLGDLEQGCVTFSPSIGAINKIRPVKEIVEDIAQGFA